MYPGRNGATAQNGAKPMGVDLATHQMVYPLEVKSFVYGATLRWTIDRTGFLQRIILPIRGQFGTLVGTPNGLGQASLIKRISLLNNRNTKVYSLSGLSQYYILPQYLDEPQGLFTNSTARTSLASNGDITLDTVIPSQINQRDKVGLNVLASDQNNFTLEIECASLADVLTGGGAASPFTTTPTFAPFVEWLTRPKNPQDFPFLFIKHTILDEEQDIPGAGHWVYDWPRGNTYLQMVHAFGVGAGNTGADQITDLEWQVNRNTSPIKAGPDLHYFDVRNWLTRGQPRLKGLIPFDFLSQSGQGAYGKMSDALNTADINVLQTVGTATTSGTMTHFRREFVYVNPSGPQPTK